MWNGYKCREPVSYGPALNGRGYGTVKVLHGLGNVAALMCLIFKNVQN